MTPRQARIKALLDGATLSQNPKDLAEINRAAQFILAQWLTYKQVGDELSIPPWVIGCLHYRESDFDFGTWLCNGDPIFDASGTPIKTSHVPQGLGPCSTWQDAALLSLKNQGWNQGLHWDIVDALENLLLWNGTGYEALIPPINSPYLWSMTNHYSKGKYVADGIYDPNIVDSQAGCAAIIISLKSMGVINAV